MVSALIPTAAGLSGYDEQPVEAEAALNRMFEEMEAAWEAKEWERLVDMEVQVWVDGPGQPAGRAPAAVREKVRAMCLEQLPQPDRRADPAAARPACVRPAGRDHRADAGARRRPG